MKQMRHLSTFLPMVIVSVVTTVNAQPFFVGHTTINFTDPSRNRPIATEVYYPADVAGVDVAFTQQPITAPIVTFGHGFVMTWDAYSNIWEELVANGYVVAFPKTETGFAPDHLALGKDLAYVVTALQTEAATTGSRFFGRLDSSACVMGHSMGGGAAFLAVQYNSSIRAMITLAAAETSTSAIGAATAITIPSLVFAGANDCVTPPSVHQIPMYDSLASSCKAYISINGASHCQMAEVNALCSFGEATCTPPPAISRATQHVVLNRYMVPWLNYQLKNDCVAGTSFASTIATDTEIAYQLSCTICPSTTGINSSEWTAGVKVFPNPANDALNLLFPHPFSGYLTLMDLQGKIIEEIRIENSTSFSADISGLPEGFYGFRLRDDLSMTQYQSFIKSK
jgi:pimeloyl-ACP methyl ester carboxylesterase